jgi:hypothetical protein
VRLTGTLLPQGAFAVQAYPSVAVDEREGDLNVEVKITVFGTAPTYKFQGSNDPVQVSDANSDWYDMDMNPSTGAPAATHSPAATGVYGYGIPSDEPLPQKIRINVSVTGSCSGDAQAYQ